MITNLNYIIPKSLKTNVSKYELCYVKYLKFETSNVYAIRLQR